MKSTLQWTFVFLLSFLITSTSWAKFTKVTCQSPADNKYLEVHLSNDQKLSVSTRESTLLILDMKCDQVSEAGPLVRCFEATGPDQTYFYSFSRTQSGFTSPFSDQMVDSVSLHFVFERNFVNAAGRYVELKREFQFLLNECVLE